MARVKRGRQAARESACLRKTYDAQVSASLSRSLDGSPLEDDELPYILHRHHRLEAIISETRCAQGRRLLLAKWTIFPAVKATWELERRFTTQELAAWETQKQELEAIEQQFNEEDAEEQNEEQNGEHGDQHNSQVSATVGSASLESNNEATVDALLSAMDVDEGIEGSLQDSTTLESASGTSNDEAAIDALPSTMDVDMSPTIDASDSLEPLSSLKQGDTNHC